jgi:hypothetical protein
MKGLAPGAALVLLLAGPATNLASALVVSRQLGKSGTAVYFGGVAAGSLAAGGLVQALAPTWRLGEIEAHTQALPGWTGPVLATTLLIAILLPALIRWRRREAQTRLRETSEQVAPRTGKLRQP